MVLSFEVWFGGEAFLRDKLTVTFQGNHRAFGTGSLAFRGGREAVLRGLAFFQERMCLELVKTKAGSLKEGASV